MYNLTAFFSNFFPIGISFRGGRKRRPFNSNRVPQKLHRTNQEIRASEVRLLDSEGELLGVMPLSEALALSQEKGVDLVEISPKAVPPVCKIIDYGKMLYSLKKKEQQSKTMGKAKEMKGIRITFRIDSGDMDRQRQKAEEFLSEGHPVRIQLVMKGREKAHRDIAYEKMKTFVEALAEVSKLEGPPRGAGHQIIAILKPSKS